MKKVLLISAVLLSIGISCISLFAFPKSFSGLFANGIESLTGDDDPLGDIVVDGERTLYYFQTTNSYNGVHNVSVYVQYAGEIWVSCIDLYCYESMYCCGDGNDECHPFRPNKDPWRCAYYKRGKNFWGY